MTADQLHTHAIEAEKHAEQLATGLSQAGADPSAVKSVTECATLLRKIAVILAKGGTQPTTDQAISHHFAQQRAAQAQAAPPAAAQPPA